MPKKTKNSNLIYKQKVIYLIIIITLLTPTSLVSSSPSKTIKDLTSNSTIYYSDDADIYLTETISENNYVMDLEISINDYKKETLLINGDDYLSLTLGESITSTTEEGKPMLPTINKLIAIPYNSSYSLEMLDSQYKNIKLDYKVQPFQAELYGYTSYNENEFVIDRSIYENNDFYPKNTASVITHGIFRDFQIILLQINPFSYNPVRDEIKFYNKLNVRLEFDKKPMRIRESEMRNDIYEGIILNYDKAKNWPTYKDRPADGYDYLIITDEAFFDSLTPLKQNRETFGITTNIVKTSEIGTRHSHTEIKNYIKDEYNNQGISYVLLVGDVEHIPIQDLGDHYYTLLDGNDLYPEIAIGRFSVKNTQELDNIVSKTVGYATYNPKDDGWEKNVLFTEGEGNLAKPVKEYIANDVIPEEMTVNKVYPSEGGTKQEIKNHMNQGQLIVNYLGHGSPTEWCGPKVYASDLTGLNNAGKLPLIFSCSCNNGKIESECMAEKVHRAEASCIAYFASSRPCLIVVTNEFDKDLFRTIYNDEIDVIGDVILHAKSTLLGKHSNCNEVKMYILLGDPTLKLKSPGPELSFSPTSYDFEEKEKGITDSTNF